MKTQSTKKQIPIYMPWFMTLFMVGKKEYPVNVEINRRFMSKDAATCVHIGILPEERGERKSVAMLSKPETQGKDGVNILMKSRVTGFKVEIASHRFRSEEEARALIWVMTLTLSRLTEESEFIGWIVDYPNLNVYSSTGERRFSASVYVLSKYPV